MADFMDLVLKMQVDISSLESGMTNAVNGINRVNTAISQLSSATRSHSQSMTENFTMIDMSLLKLVERADTASDMMVMGFSEVIPYIQRMDASMIVATRTMTVGFREVIRELTTMNLSLRNTQQSMEQIIREMRLLEESSRGAARGVQNVGTSFAVATQHGGRFLSGISSTIANIWLLQMAVQDVGLVMKFAFGQGIEFAAQMETSIVGMAGIISSSFKHVSDGTDIDFTEGMVRARSAIEMLKTEALSSTATLEELTATFQAVLGPAAALNMTFDQIKDFTVFGANAVKSLGLRKDQLVQELRSIVTQNITTRASTVATALGITNEQVAEASQSAEGLFAFLKNRMRGFSEAARETENTMIAIWSNIMDGIQQTQERGFARVFTGLKKELKTLQEQFFNIKRWQVGDAYEDGKTLKEGDAKVGTIKESSLNEATVEKFALLGYTVEKIYFDIKKWVVEITTAGTSLDTLRSVANSLYIVIAAIYNNFSNILSIFAVWKIATGGLLTSFLALATAAGRIDNVAQFIADHINECALAMLTFSVYTSAAKIAFDTMMNSTARLSTVMRGLSGLILPVAGIVLMIATEFYGVETVLAFIKEHLLQITIILTGLTVATLVGQFGLLYAGVVSVFTAVAFLASQFSNFDSIMAGVIVTLGVLTLMWATYTAWMGRAAIATAYHAAVLAITNAATKAMAIAQGIYNAVLVVYELACYGAAMATAALSAATLVAALPYIALAAAVAAVLYIIYRLADFLLGGLSSAYDWIKGKIGSVIGILNESSAAWDKETDAVIRNKMAKQMDEQTQKFRKQQYLENMGISEEDYNRDNAMRIAKGDEYKFTEKDLADSRKVRDQRLQDSIGNAIGTKNTPSDKNGDKKAQKEAKEALQNFLKTLDGELAEFTAQKQAEIKALEYAYQEGVLGIYEYFRQMNEKLTDIANKKKETYDAEIAYLTETGLDETKLIDLTEKRKKVDDELNKQILENAKKQLAALKDMKKEVQSLQVSYMEKTGQFEEANSIEWQMTNAEKIMKWKQNLEEVQNLKADPKAWSELDATTKDYYTFLLKNLPIALEYMEKDKALSEQLSKIKKEEWEVNKLLAEQEKEEIKLKYSLGLYTQDEWEYQNRLYELHRRNMPQLIAYYEKLAEYYDKMYNDTGKAEYLVSANKARQAIYDLKSELSPLGTFVKDNVGSALQDMFTDMIDGTKSVTEAFHDMAKAILKDISSILAQRAASSIVNGILNSMFGSGTSGSTSGISASSYISKYGSPFSSTGWSFAGGGAVTGEGTSTSDSIPSFLSNGEFVIKAAAVSKYGKEMFESLNNLRIPRFAEGGYVGRGTTSGSSAPKMSVNIVNNTGSQITAQPKMEFNGDEYVLSVVIDGLNRDKMGLRSMLQTK